MNLYALWVIEVRCILNNTMDLSIHCLASHTRPSEPPNFVTEQQTIMFNERHDNYKNFRPERFPYPERDILPGFRHSLGKYKLLVELVHPPL